MTRQRIRRKPMADINVVPYIDVMLVMLVIFMITAPLLTQGVKVDLPETDAEPLPAEQPEPLIVTVDASGSRYLNFGDAQGTPVDDETLVKRVSILVRRRHDKTVLVRGDHAVDYGTVVAAMVLLQRAGVPHVGLITEPPK